MPKLKIPAAFLVIGVMSLGAPAIAASVTPLSAVATPAAGAGGTAGAAGMVDAIAAVPTVAGAART